MPIRPRRSVLYMPASNARALEKARSLDADAVIFDLEDAVAPDAKEMARGHAVDAANRGGYGRREVVVRINALSSEWGSADLAAVAQSAADAVLVPKVSCAANLAEIQNGLGKDAPQAIWAMMETPQAILRAGDIAASKFDVAPSFSVMVLGTNDLAKETRAALAPGRLAYLPWLMQVVAAARSAGLDVIDGVFNDFQEIDRFRAECMQGREFGMDGKTLIHPKQIEPANEAFSPLPDELEWARKVCAVFDDSANRDVGVAQVDGRMVERLHADMARRVLLLADAINA
ncbi:HpcH/HpaI aldolase/citrate lyase family protein [Georhizobium sp. MAB10]|uniref:HpcH/HpaI aldolase/citrate lyase family protein n=1 Tax=Georhizobium sp. MAB10 TaxID=3028319 RepID=UPI003855A1AE